MAGPYTCQLLHRMVQGDFQLAYVLDRRLNPQGGIVRGA
jgi:hypothetical protein